MGKNKVGIETYLITCRRHALVDGNKKKILDGFIEEVKNHVEFDRVDIGDFMLFSVNNQYKVIGFEKGDFVQISCDEFELSKKKLAWLRMELGLFIKDVFDGLSVADNGVLRGL